MNKYHFLISKSQDNDNQISKRALEGTYGREAMGGSCGPGEPSGVFLWNVDVKEEVSIYSVDMDESKRKPLSVKTGFSV